MLVHRKCVERKESIEKELNRITSGLLTEEQVKESRAKIEKQLTDVIWAVYRLDSILSGLGMEITNDRRDLLMEMISREES